MPAKAFVRSTRRIRKGQYHWKFDTVDSEGKIVHSDNTGNWRVIFDEAVESVSAVRAIEADGLIIQYSWEETVDMAPDL